MYCKNCGKKLEDDARFCDRCNMSVRKKEGKQEIIDELKEQRLARSKAKVIEDRLRKIKRVKRRRHSIIVSFIIVIVLAGGLSFAFSFMANRSEESPFNKQEQLQTTHAPVTTDKSQKLNADGYIEIKVSGAKFAYPSGFEADKTKKDCLLCLKDKSGDAQIIINKKSTDKTPSELMSLYRDSIENAKAKESLAGNNGYTITVTASGVIRHRKSFVKNGEELYYEMSYPADSAKARQYEDCISYIDEYFKAS